jgi:hypothetical protein
MPGQISRERAFTERAISLYGILSLSLLLTLALTGPV